MSARIAFGLTLELRQDFLRRPDSGRFAADEVNVVLRELVAIQTAGVVEQLADGDAAAQHAEFGDPGGRQVVFREGAFRDELGGERGDDGFGDATDAKDLGGIHRFGV
ncbi:MAG: hypothetical protein BWY63_03846 [Chloroflexi bacterium ADurb.Bin360]|nr:MAG: hypothetical protein BWY63_03846 [Chloroflexi bacterium ADurb.Bin360]